MNHIETLRELRKEQERIIMGSWLQVAALTAAIADMERMEYLEEHAYEIAGTPGVVYSIDDDTMDQTVREAIDAAKQDAPEASHGKE